MTPLFDRVGEVGAWVREEGVIYDLSDFPVAFIMSHDIYSFSGEHKGRFSSGYLRDHYGNAVGWVRGAKGGPLLPIPSVPPIPPIPAVPPVPPIPSIPPIAAI